ncbi:LiaF transmembrane domain-containing protein [Pedobacter frigoris]|uniref:LiaF transmembrane domain-containing protein n=1 Tax=Pedobacter frigoris TaxID=2571272 RepID=A0A4U1CMD3_9SPHI|nr:DUF5668 domain-containing protein [Pedobacter frigoris]TKC09021.1 hypothetical protein FA047_02695 [Pedobacter frigoris]
MGNLKTNNSSRICTGLVVLLIGVVFLLDNIGLNIPKWIFDWPILLIAIGLLVGYKRKFEVGLWMFFVAVGGFLTIESIVNVDFSKYYFALIFIAIGVFLIIKPKGRGFQGKRWKKKWAQKCAGFEGLGNQAEDNAQTPYDIDKNDILDTVNVFGGSHQNIYSKNFRGGDAIAIFGGSDINLSQADFEGTISLDVVAIFGGVKIVVPPSWDVKSEVTAIFGGIDDKRALGQVLSEPKKTIIIKGVALFGGVDIRNF